MVNKLLQICALVAIGVSPISAQAIDQEFTCNHIEGVALIAPDWKSVDDRFRDQSVVLTSIADQGLGNVRWSNGTTYSGFAIQAAGGFVIIAVGPDWTETYHMSVSGLELMMTATRGGSSVLPNDAKAFHGTCQPGAH